MRIVIDQGGFNLNYVNFSIPLVTGVAAVEGMSGIAIYPNPVQAGASISIQFVNQDPGKYQVRMYNYLGAMVFTSMIHTNAGVSPYPLPLPQNIPAGYYQLEVLGDDGFRSIKKVVVQ